MRHSTVSELLRKAISVERDVGTPIGICAIKQAQQTIATFNLRTKAGRASAVNVVEELVSQKGCKACSVLDQGAADLRIRYKLGSSPSK